MWKHSTIRMQSGCMTAVLGFCGLLLGVMLSFCQCQSLVYRSEGLDRKCSSKRKKAQTFLTVAEVLNLGPALEFQRAGGLASYACRGCLGLLLFKLKRLPAYPCFIYSLLDSGFLGNCTTRAQALGFQVSEALGSRLCVQSTSFATCEPPPAISHAYIDLLPILQRYISIYTYVYIYPHCQQS